MTEFTKKPKNAPTFNAAAFTAKLAAGEKISPALAAQFIAWKQWVESTNAYASADAGGLRAVLKADALAVDALKANVDVHGDRLNNQAARLDAVEAQLAAQPRPFP
jgi:hypothetical protein